MLKVGLTGNFGMGKSTAGEVFRSLGAFVIDTDAIVKELFEDRKVQQELIELFGRVILRPDGTIDRPLIARVVFSNHRLKTRLEDLLHPFVFRKIDEAIEVHSDQRLVIIEAPLIFERGYEGRFDVIINISCSEQKAIERLKSKGYTVKEVTARLDTQMPAVRKSELADFNINNEGDMTSLKDQVQKIYSILQRMANDSDKGLYKETQD